MCALINHLFPGAIDNAVLTSQDNKEKIAAAIAAAKSLGITV